MLGYEWLTERKVRLALYTASMALNILSSSLGGKLDFDQAAATFCREVARSDLGK